METETDAFVKFFASWCPHCQSIKGKYEDLAAFFDDPEMGVDILELEAPKNDIPGISVMSYPTLYLFRAGQKTNVLEYDGPNERDAWIVFLAKYSPKYMAYLEKHPDKRPEILDKLEAAEKEEEGKKADSERKSEEKKEEKAA